MPTGVYDSSLITQRARAKAESNSFINRIQNPTTPRTSYGPLTGIYDNSEVNRVNNGQMKYFQRNGACTVAYIGCPCTVTTPSGEVVNNVSIVAPGQVTGVTVTYGSIIVSWNTPTGTGPLTYTITTSPSTTPVQVVNSTQYIYTNPTAIFTPGTLYSFFVQASNSAGSGTISSSTPSSSIYAPYNIPTNISTQALISAPNTIFINFSPYYFGSGTTLPPTQYTLIKYVNGVETTTITDTYTTNQIVISTGLNAIDEYSFKFQLSRPGDNKYTSYTSLTTPTKIYPAGPTVTGYSNYTTAEVQINYNDYSVNGYSLTSGATCTVTDGTTALTIKPGSLTNTSVVVEALSPATEYSSYTIAFSKSPYNPSATTNLPTFYTYGNAPSGIIYTVNSTSSITVGYTDYSQTGQGGFDLSSGSAVILNGTTPLNYNSLGNESFDLVSLTPGTNYNNVSVILYNGSTPSSSTLRSITFNLQFTTPSAAPTGFAVSSLTSTNGIFNFDEYSPFSGTTAISMFATKNGTDFVEISGTNITNGQGQVKGRVTFGGFNYSDAYTNAYIVIYNSPIQSLNSDSISFNVPYPSPSYTTGIATCTTQAFTFNYSNPPYFTPNSAEIRNAPSGVNITLDTTFSPNYTITITDLTPQVRYTGIEFRILDSSNPSSLVSEWTLLPQIITPAPDTEGSISNLSATPGVEQIILNYDQFTTFSPSGAIVTATTAGTLTTYPATNITDLGLTLENIAYGTILSNITVILTNYSICKQSNSATLIGGDVQVLYPAPGNPSGNPPGTITVPVDSITQDSAVIFFTPTYTFFSPTVANTTVSGGLYEISVSAATTNSVTVSGLTTGQDYAGYSLRLGFSGGTSAPSDTIPTFTPQWPAPINVTSGPNPNPIYATIGYSEYNTSFIIQSATLINIPNGNVPNTELNNSAFIIQGLNIGTIYSGGSFYLTNTSSQQTREASIPEFITGGGPDTPIVTQVTRTNSADTFCTITFNQYSVIPADIICVNYYDGTGSYTVADITDSSATINGLSPFTGVTLKIRVIGSFSYSSQWSNLIAVPT